MGVYCGTLWAEFFPGVFCWGHFDTLGLYPSEKNVQGQPQVPPGEGSEGPSWLLPGTQAVLTLPCHLDLGIHSCPISQGRKLGIDV